MFATILIVLGALALAVVGCAALDPQRPGLITAKIRKGPAARTGPFRLPLAAPPGSDATPAEAVLESQP